MALKEPWPGGVIMLKSQPNNAYPRIYQRFGTSRGKIWCCTDNAFPPVSWAEIEINNTEADITVLFPGMPPEPDEDTNILVIGKFGGIDVYWHGTRGWFTPCIAEPTQWRTILSESVRIIILSAGKTLKFNTEDALEYDTSKID
jgi:hypothetical protein